ncbi:MAG: acyltransferase [Silanimonas sp.]|nr:MAG: acyltransferase [Silanimonas sp.]
MQEASTTPPRCASGGAFTPVVPALDGLRGLAVLIVLGSHLANAGLPVLPGVSLAGTGKSGVYLFFVLSAFLLTRLLLARPPEDWRRPALWLDYALRRVLRIWPLYLVVLLASAALTSAGLAPWWPYPMDPAALRQHLLLQQGVSVLWSIPVEFHYYLWLPLGAAVLASAQRAGGIGLAAALTICASVVAMQLWPPRASAVNDVRLGPYLVLFFAGAWAAVLSLHYGAASVRSRRAFGLLGLSAVFALVATVPAVPAILGLLPFTPDLNHRWFAFFAVAWATLLLAVLHGPAWLRRPFEWRPLRALGWVSFSAYLWHMPVLAAVIGPMGLTGTLALGVFAVLTAFISWASWRLIERPLQAVRWPSSRRGLTGP